MAAAIVSLAGVKRERRLRERQARVMARVVDEVLAVVGPVSGADDVAALTGLVAEKLLANFPALFEGDIVDEKDAA